MKRLIFAGLVMALFSGNTVFAQSNNNYSDDVYYNGSQAERDAQADAKKQKKQQQTQDQEEQYNSSTGDGYTDNDNNGNSVVYNNSYNSDDATIDYDDDSYTSRMRRFYYPMANVGYWGGVYSPFWSDPFYSNPYYGWGGWYTPGFSVSIGTGFGWGAGPYWNNCWGMNTWFGYGGFGSWYSPYYGGFGGFGGWGGYGGGYWNGYYAGLHDGRYGGGIYNPVRNVNYGPRNSRVGLSSVGAYGRNARMTSVDRGSNMVQPFNRSANNNNNGSRNTQQFQTGNSERNLNGNVRSNRDAINLDRSNVRIFDGNNGGRNVQQITPNSTDGGATRRGGFFNRGGGGSERSFQQRSESNGNFSQPSRSFEQRGGQSQPNRSFSSPAPSRSFSSPSPSRSSGGFGGGGGSRGGGGRGR